MTIILIPGLMNDGWVWHNQIGPLSRIAAVHVARTDGCDTLTAMAQRIVETTSGPLKLVGHSMGGRVALEVAALAPDRVAAMALLDTGAGGPKESERAGRMALVDIARSEGMAAVARAWLPPMVAPERREDTALVAGITAMLERCDPQDFARQQNALLIRPDRLSLIPTLDCPLLAITGSEDQWAPAAQHEEMAHLARNGRLSVVEGSGHMLPVEQPDALNALLLDFFATQ